MVRQSAAALLPDACDRDEALVPVSEDLRDGISAPPAVVWQQSDLSNIIPMNRSTLSPGFNASLFSVEAVARPAQKGNLRRAMLINCVCVAGSFPLNPDQAKPFCPFSSSCSTMFS